MKMDPVEGEHGPGWRWRSIRWRNKFAPVGDSGGVPPIPGKHRMATKGVHPLFLEEGFGKGFVVGHNRNVGPEVGTHVGVLCSLPDLWPQRRSHNGEPPHRLRGL